MSRLSLTPVNLPALASAPSSAVAGDMYFDTTQSGQYVYNGAAWVATGGSTGTQLIFTGFDGGTATTTSFDLTLDLGAAA